MSGKAAVAEVQLSGVCKRFGPIEALRGINLTIPDRTYLCLLGPSGCGKTTLCGASLVSRRWMRARSESTAGVSMR
jgi:ABC-type branched-subunit amino acid transport system ATPase component